MPRKRKTIVLNRHYRLFKDIKSGPLVKFWHLGRYYTVTLRSKDHTLLFKIEEDGKVILVVPFTKDGVRKIKKYLNRIIDI